MGTQIAYKIFCVYMYEGISGNLTMSVDSGKNVFFVNFIVLHLILD